MIAYFKSLDPKGARAGLAAVVLLGAGIVLGSRTLRYYDPILLTYTFGTLFSAFAVAYRYAVWLQRPATRMYARRVPELLGRGGLGRNLAFAARTAWGNLLAQRFIRRRGKVRWVTHFLIAWGCVLAGAVTFPLVFGWLHFQSVPERPEVYRILFLGLAVGTFDTASPVRYVLFNLLNLSAVMVIAGASLALRRRLRDPASLARQQFGNDLVPLILLLAISVTGLMLTFSTHALGGAGSQVLSLVHALTVCATLLYLPFGKLFHIVQRPLHVAVHLYRRAEEGGPAARCRRCGNPFASARQMEDLREVLAASGLAVEADVCPRCRRCALGVSQGRLLEEARRG